MTQYRGDTEVECRRSAYRCRIGAALVLAVVVLAACTGTVAAQATTAPDCSNVGYTQDADGNYEVTNVSQLQCMGTTSDTLLTDSFVLTQDIDASGTSSWNGGAGFEQIDDFEGTLDGQGYEITGLTIDRPGETRVGLFGQTFGTVDVENLELVDVNITASFTSGTLLGLGDANVSDTYVTGSVTGENVGGLIGRFNGGRITRSYTDVEVDAASGNAGGLVETMNGGNIEESYALGDAEGGGGFASVGGLVGFGGGGTVRDSYARGNATATGSDGDAGGLVGTTGSFGGVSVENAYSTGVVSGSTNEGGFAGDFSGGITAGYWDTQSSGTTTGIGSGSGDVTGLTTSQITGTSAESNMSEFDFTGPWSTVTSPADYPVLGWQDEAGEPYFVVEITGSNSPVTVGEALNVSVEVQNVGAATGTQTVELFYDNGTGETAADSLTVDGLSPDSTETVELRWDTGSGDFGTVDLRVTSDNDNDTATAEVRKDALYDVAVVSSDPMTGDGLVNSLESGLSDAGVLGDYRLVQEQPPDVTGSNASGAVDMYDRIVVNDFGGFGGGEGFVPPVPDGDVSDLYDEIDVNSETRIVSLDMGNLSGTQISNAVERRADVLGDLDGVNRSDSGSPPVQMGITQNHPLFEDVGSAGDTIDVYNAGGFGTPTRAWFVGYDGDSFAEIGESGGTDGQTAGVTTNDNEVLLSLGGLGTGPIEPTPDAERILANAIIFPFEADISTRVDAVSDRGPGTPVFVNGTVLNRGSQTDNLRVTAKIVDESDGTVEASETLQVRDTDDAGSRLTELEANSTEVSFRFGSLSPLNLDGTDYTANLTATDDNTSAAFDTDGFNVTGTASNTTGCIDRRHLGRGQLGQECPTDRTLQRGESRRDLDRQTGRDSDTARRNRRRSSRGRSRSR